MERHQHSNAGKGETIAEKLGLGTGEHKLKLGKSFEKSSTEGFHTFRYDFKPASIDPEKGASVEIGSGNQVTVTVPHQERSGGASQTVFKGSKKPYHKECVLIIDHVTGEITLERLTSNVQLKKTRSETVCNPPKVVNSKSGQNQQSSNKDSALGKNSTQNGALNRNSTQSPQNGAHNRNSSQNGALNRSSNQKGNTHSTAKNIQPVPRGNSQQQEMRHLGNHNPKNGIAAERSDKRPLVDRHPNFTRSPQTCQKDKTMPNSTSGSSNQKAISMPAFSSTQGSAEVGVLSDSSSYTDGSTSDEEEVQKPLKTQPTKENVHSKEHSASRSTSEGKFEFSNKGPSSSQQGTSRSASSKENSQRNLSSARNKPDRTSIDRLPPGGKKATQSMHFANNKPSASGPNVLSQDLLLSETGSDDSD